MLYVLLNWGYLFATAFLTGFAVLRPFRRLGYCCGKATGMLMAGLAALTVYAQVFSLFGGVGFGQCAPAPVLPVGYRIVAQAAAFLLEEEDGSYRTGRPGAAGMSYSAYGLWNLQRIYACGHGAVSRTGHPVDRRVRRGMRAGQPTQPLCL